MYNNLRYFSLKVNLTNVSVDKYEQGAFKFAESGAEFNLSNVRVKKHCTCGFTDSYFGEKHEIDYEEKNVDVGKSSSDEFRCIQLFFQGNMNESELFTGQ